MVLPNVFDFGKVNVLANTLHWPSWPTFGGAFKILFADYEIKHKLK